MGASRERELAAERAVVGSLYERLDLARQRTREDLRRAQHDQTAGTPAALTEQDAFVRRYTERRTAVVAAETASSAAFLLVPRSSASSSSCSSSSSSTSSKE